MEKLTKININVILCANSDEKVTNIENIFNVLKRQANDRQTFDIITVINAIGVDESSETFTLVYAFVKQDDKSSQINIADVASFEIKNEFNDEFSKYSNISQGQMYSRIHIDNRYFPGAGQYELQIYKFEGEVDSEKIDKIRKTGEYEDKIECIVNFEIVE